MKKELVVLALILVAFIGISFFILNREEIIFSPEYNSTNNIISSCGNITESGDYTMNQSLNEGEVILFSSNGCIDIQASNVVLDCQGNFIRNSSLEIIGIYSQNNEGISIKNCNISFSNGAGIRITGSSNLVIENNILDGNIFGIIITSATGNNVLRNNAVSSSSDSGVYILDSNGTKIFSLGAESNNNTISVENSLGVYLLDSNISDSNTKIIRMLLGSELIALNATYNGNKEDLESLSKITRKWNLDINTKNVNNGFLDSVEIKAYDSFGNLSLNKTTNESGVFNSEIKEYENIGGVKTYYSNYNINSTREGCIMNSSSINITGNTNLNITLIGNVGPQMNEISPSNGTIYSESSLPKNVRFSWNINSANGIRNCSVDIDGTAYYNTSSDINSIVEDKKVFVELGEGSYNYYINCIDFLNYQKNSSIISFKIESDEDPNNNNNNNNNANNNQTQEFWTITYNASASEITSGYNKNLGARERVRMIIAGAPHHVGIILLTSNSAVINISSDPQQATFVVGEEKKFEINGDGFLDLRIKLNSIVNSKANITVTEIHEEIVINSAGNNNQSQNSTNSTLNNSDSSDNFWKFNSTRVVLVILAFASLVVIGVLLWIFFDRRRTDSRWSK